MTAQPKSAYVNLYDQESKHDDYKFQVENKQAYVSMKDTKGTRPFQLYFDDIVFAKKGGLQSYQPRERFVAAESDIDDNTAAHGVNASGLAAEIARAQQAEGVNSAAVSAANTARGALQSALEAADTVLTNAVAAETSARAAAISAEQSARAAAVAVEKARAEAAEAAIQAQITNILSNVSAGSLDSLSEIVTAFQAADGTLTGALATLQSSFDDLKDRVDELTL